AYMNIPVAHTMGGEVTGTIDESIRHAVTKLAHVHFPANQDAADRIIRMGEDPSTVHVVGCPRIDLISELLSEADGLDEAWIQKEGVGAHVDTREPFLLVSQHPVTTEYGSGEAQIGETLAALETLDMPTIMLWPNVDAGSDDVSRGMRKFRETHRPEHIRFYKNFPVEMYARLMYRSACLVGNSSAPIREGAFLGTPTVNIGTRQQGRQRGANVVDVAHDRRAIVDAVRAQVAHGRYPSEHIYGDGAAGPRIADILATAPLKLQKQITY
ncbi:MAG: UDP-N-acetylglucosamine 2-epimerase, partial [Vicinamibacterales bacterium]